MIADIEEVRRLLASPRSAQTRKTHTDEKVFRATVDLLRSGGVHAVTVEAVAARSGVAKTTIYRRHTDRNAMLQAALNHYLPRVDTIDDADPRQGLAAAVRAVTAAIERYVGLSVAVALATGDDTAAGVVRDEVIQPRMEQLVARLTAWKATGVLRHDLDVDLTVSTIIGTVVVTYARNGTFAPDWPERFVDHIWLLLRPSGRCYFRENG